MQIRLNVLRINRRLRLIGREHMNPVRPLRRLIRSHHHHAVLPSLRRARPVRLKAHNHLGPTVAQILRLRMSLAAIAQDGDSLALQRIGISVMLIKDSGHKMLLISTCRAGALARRS